MLRDISNTISQKQNSSNHHIKKHRKPQIYTFSNQSFQKIFKHDQHPEIISFGMDAQEPESFHSRTKSQFFPVKQHEASQKWDEKLKSIGNERTANLDNINEKLKNMIHRLEIEDSPCFKQKQIEAKLDKSCIFKEKLQTEYRENQTREKKRMKTSYFQSNQSSMFYNQNQVKKPYFPTKPLYEDELNYIRNKYKLKTSQNKTKGIHEQPNFTCKTHYSQKFQSYQKQNQQNQHKICIRSEQEDSVKYIDKKDFQIIFPDKKEPLIVRGKNIDEQIHKIQLRIEKINTDKKDMEDQQYKKIGKIWNNAKTSKKRELQNFLQKLQKQIELDSKFRDAKKWFTELSSAYKWIELSRKLKQFHVKLDESSIRQIFLIKNCQENRSSNKYSTFISIEMLIELFIDCEEHWFSHIVKKFDQNKLADCQFTAEFIDIKEKGHIQMEDFVGYFNRNLIKQYERKDWILIFERLKSDERLFFEDIIEICCE